MNDEAISNIVTIVAVAFGWLLSEATGWIKNWRRTRVLKKAIDGELSDARQWLNRSKIILGRAIQFCVLGEVLTEGYVQIPTHIYNQHFTEASLKLSPSERAVFNGTYNVIKMVNASYAKLEERVIACQKNQELNVTNELLPLLNTIYYNTHSAIFQITLYLNNKKKFDMFNIPAEASRRLDDEVTNELNRLYKEARELGLDKLRRKFHELP